VTPRRCWIPACSRRSGPASSGAASPQDTIGAKPEPVRFRLMTSPVTAFIGIVTAGVSSGMNLTMQVGGSSVQVRSRAGTRIHLRLRTAAQRGGEIVARRQRLSAFDLGTSGPPTFSAHGGQVCIFLRVYQSFSDPHVTPGRAQSSSGATATDVANDSSSQPTTVRRVIRRLRPLQLG